MDKVQDHTLTGIAFSKDPYGNDLVDSDGAKGWHFHVKLAHIESGVSPQYRRPGTRSVIDTTSVQWSATIRWLSNTEFVFRGARQPYYHRSPNNHKTFAGRFGIAGLQSAAMLPLSWFGAVTGPVMDALSANDRLFYNDLGLQYGDSFWMINDFTLVVDVAGVRAVHRVSPNTGFRTIGDLIWSR